MKLRKILAALFYAFCVASLFAAGYVSFLSYSGKITIRFGFLLFMPIWIISYWFSTFFYLAVRKKTNKGVTYAISRKLAKNLNKITNGISFLLLAYWIFVYVRQYISYKHL